MAMIEIVCETVENVHVAGDSLVGVSLENQNLHQEGGFRCLAPEKPSLSSFWTKSHDRNHWAFVSTVRLTC